MSELSKKLIRPDFFCRCPHEVARDLLGRVLARNLDGEERRARIVEVEVYEGRNDLASHARAGVPTKRTWPMFEDPGTVYVYKIYGMYRCLNLRAGTGEEPGAVLIRAAEPLSDRAEMAMSRGLIEDRAEYTEKQDARLLSGPAKLCQALQVDFSANGTALGEVVAVEAGTPIWRTSPESVASTSRIGLNPKTCGESADWPWRYVVKGSPWLSR